MARRASPTSALSALALAGALALAVLASCAGSGYTYVQNTEAKVYFKLPEDWELYREGDILADEVAEEDLEALSEQVWLRGFDGAGSPAPEHVLASDAEEPRGLAEVRPIPPAERDSLSLATLRQTGFGQDPTTGQPIDPVVYAQANPDGAIELLDYEELVLDSGARGVRLSARIEGESTVVFDRITMVDAATERRYSFTVGCLAACWDEHEDVLAEIADSWTLEDSS
ncbi:MAG: hypothetical protein M3R01_04960 [Actinomycetota bacterium]|nr:hypothetical protein [Actinomycetota bacterium]